MGSGQVVQGSHVVVVVQGSQVGVGQVVVVQVVSHVGDVVVVPHSSTGSVVRILAALELAKRKAPRKMACSLTIRR